MLHFWMDHPVSRICSRNAKRPSLEYSLYSSGEYLLAEISDDSPHLLIVDLSGDEKTSMQSIESIRVKFDPKALPLVAISDNSLDADTLQRLEAVGSRWLTVSGSNVDVMLASIEELMALSLEET